MHVCIEFYKIILFDRNIFYVFIIIRRKNAESNYNPTHKNIWN